MSYARGTYDMRLLTLTVPTLNNAREEVLHIERVRFGLLQHGIESWTETPVVGFWRGKREDGTLISVYVGEAIALRTARVLDAVGRAAMPDQEAIQVTCSQSATTLWEA